MSDGTKVIKLHDRMCSEREEFESLWELTSTYNLPNKSEVYDWKSASKGSRKNLRVYDSTAIHYNELLASALHSMMTNPTAQWFELTTGDQLLDSNPAVREGLQKIVRKIHAILNNSNFQTEIHEVYLDLGCFGTGTLLIERDDENIIRFKSDPIYQMYIKESHKGDVDTVSKVYMYTIEQMIEKYGEDFLKEPVFEHVKKDSDKKYEIVHMVMPRSDAERAGLKGPKGMSFASYHVVRQGNIILKESGFRTFPYAVPRWIKISGEVYGRSPAMKALPDTMMLNQMMRTTLRAAQKVVDPPLMVPDDGSLSVNSTPGGINPYRAGTQDRIYPLETRGNIGIGLQMMQDARDRIKQSFFIDQLQLKDGPQMTATEANIRNDDNLRILSPILGRQHFELLQPMIARIVDVMLEQGEMPEDLPAELEGVNLKVFYSSQVAKAQRMGEAMNLDRYMMSLTQMAQVDPSVMQIIDMEKYGRYMAELDGIPEDILKTPQEIKKIQQAQASAEQSAMEQQRNQSEADVMQKMASAARE